MNLPTCTRLDQGTDTDGNAATTTNSISPLAKQPIFFSVSSRTGISVNPNQPTVSFGGLTWTLVRTQMFDSTSSSRRRVSTFSALAETTPTPGTASIDFGGQNQTDVCWAIDQISRTRRDGVSGQGAIRQSNVNSDEVGVTSLSVSLSASPFPNNCTYGVFGDDGITPPSTAGSGFTIISEVKSGTNLGLTTEFKTGVDTTVDMSYSGVCFIGAIAMEIATAVIKDNLGGGPVAYNR